MAKKRTQTSDDFFITEESLKREARAARRAEKKWEYVDGIIITPDSSIDNKKIPLFKFRIFMLLVGVIISINVEYYMVLRMDNPNYVIIWSLIFLIWSVISLYWSILMIQYLFYSSNDKALINSYVNIVRKNRRLPKIEEIFYQDINDNEHITIRMNKQFQMGITFAIPLITYVQFLKAKTNGSDPFIQSELELYSGREIIDRTNYKNTTMLLEKIFNEQYTRYKEKKNYFNELCEAHKYDYMS